jgi:hypothetical protein
MRAVLAAPTLRGSERVSDMPKPMKVKIFMDETASVIEDHINAWLDDIGAATIIKMETVVTAVAEKPEDGTYPCIVVTVWYEPPDTSMPPK